MLRHSPHMPTRRRPKGRAGGQFASGAPQPKQIVSDIPLTVNIPDRPMPPGDLLEHYNNGHRDFRWQNLEGVDLAGENLSGANFEQANCAGANFHGAVLAGTNFSRAALRGADFTNASLPYAGLGASDLTDAKFCGAHLDEADIRSVESATGADFTGANLTGAALAHSDFTGADFTDADLSGTSRHRTDFSGAIGLEELVPEA